MANSNAVSPIDDELSGYVPRRAQALLAEYLRGYPIVAVTGPRQSGKSTLLTHALPGWRNVSLEDHDLRAFAIEDPRGFLARHPSPLVIDEAQHAPALLSYLQTDVDRIGVSGRYVLSGSQNLMLSARIAQSLAGRVGLIELLPLSARELGAQRLASSSLAQALHQGAFPALYSRPLAPSGYYANYTATYLERDVRQLTQVHDLIQFQRFVRLCAGRIGQLVNFSALAADTGVSQPTAAAWLAVLEATYLVRRVAPYHVNFGKRLVKAPKLYFVDTGLAAWLLGIQSAQELEHHAMRGALFENWVVMDAIKYRAERGDSRPVYFWRDNIGTEIDLLLEDAGGLTGVEVKSGQTIASDMVKHLDTWQRHVGDRALTRTALVYGGDTSQARWGTDVIDWRSLAST